jgi:predicted transcriptional regulator
MSLELESEAVRLSEEGLASRDVARLLGCSKSNT